MQFENIERRWVQRYQNFQRSLRLLEKAVAIESPDEVQCAGIVQFFEMCFELSWKLLKDYLEAQGFQDVATPRAAIKQAFQVGLVQNGTQWLKGLEDRNLMAHTYDERTAQMVDQYIRGLYLPLFQELDQELRKHL